MPLDDVATQIALANQSILTLIGKVESYHSEMQRLIDDHEERLRCAETAITQIKERQTTLALIQAAFTAIASAVSALIGRSS